MSLQTLHTPSTAPAESHNILLGYLDRFGFIPNVAAVMAQSPATLKGYVETYELLGKTDFTPAEQQLIFLAVSRANLCPYCVAAHSTVGKMMGLDDQTITAVRDGIPILNAKLSAIATFATKLVESRGCVSQNATNDFLAAGHTEAQILEVILGVSTKTISNYVNHISKTPLDAAFVPMAWAAPSLNLACVG